MRIRATALALVFSCIAACSVEAGGLGDTDDLRGTSATDSGTVAADSAVIDSTVLETSALDASEDVSDDAFEDTSLADSAMDSETASCAPACPVGESCVASGDCASGLVCRAAKCAVPVSCQELNALRPALASGVYALAGTGSPFSGYCDMSTDGGGWTLVLAYGHVAGTNPAKVVGTLPTNPLTGLSHASGAQMLALAPFDTVRFFCSTAAHARKLHFKTSNIDVISYVRGNATARNTDAMWTMAPTPLADHTADLPLNTDSTPAAPFNPAVDFRLTEYPFFDYAKSHWSIGGQGTRWECDDWASFGSATLHQVWVR